MSRSRQDAGPQMRATSATVSTRWTWRLPTSDWGQLLFASRGALTVSTNTGMWVVPPQQAVWVPALVPHEVETAPGAAMQTLYVQANASRRLPTTCRAVRVSPLLRERLRRALRRATPPAPESRHTLAEASRESGASARTLERLFRAETGLAFGTWRQRARLLRALQLLAESENVTTTAIAVGYESSSAFVAAFRRAIGVTPGQYFKPTEGRR